MKQPLPMQLFELWTLAPQVIATRLMQMTATSYPAKKSEVREMNEMWTEKVQAVVSACQAVTAESMRFQTKIFSAVVSNAMTPALIPQTTAQAMLRYGPAGGTKMTEKLVQPFHKKVKSNARRLL